MFMANSKVSLGATNITSIKLGLQSGKLYLGETLLYPLEKPIGDAVVTCDSATYNGSNQVAQNIVVTLSGVTLVARTDYTVTSNTGGTNAGTYPIVITGAGEYTGTTSGTFTINKANSSLSFSVTNLTVGIGETKTNAVTVNAGDGVVTYTSNDTSVVTVNNSGVVTGVGVGSTTVEANISSTSNYNSASTSYSVSCAAVLTAKYNVTNTSSPTRIVSGTTGFSKIEIDDVVQPRVVSAYTFSTTGVHTVKYTLKDPTSIGNQTFYSCTSLTSITIPDSVTSIGIEAFWACSSLTRLNSNVDGVFNIPSGVTSIGNGAFKKCSGLKSVTIPDSVTSIGYSVFESCYGLTSIYIPDSVTSIGNSAFTYCSGITSCTIGSGVTNIGEYAFQNCTSLTSVTIPDSVTSIGKHAFQNCNGLSSCIIGNSVTTIGQYAFSGCTSLTDIDIPDSVTTIGGGTFYECSGLTSITVNSNNTVYDSRNNCNAIIETSTNKLLYGCKNTIIPDSVTSIGNSAFTYCISLTNIDIPSGVTSIGNYAFTSCRSLTSIDIPSGVTSIGQSAFSNCKSLTSCTIGNGVTSIGTYAFQNCSGLASITSNATTAPTISSNTFYNVKTNGTLTVPIGSTGYDVWMGTGNYYLGKYNWTKVEQ